MIGHDKVSGLKSNPYFKKQPGPTALEPNTIGPERFLLK
jgi:hypothetical protein